MLNCDYIVSQTLYEDGREIAVKNYVCGNIVWQLGTNPTSGESYQCYFAQDGDNYYQYAQADGKWEKRVTTKETFVALRSWLSDFVGKYEMFKSDGTNTFFCEGMEMNFSDGLTATLKNIKITFNEDKKVERLECTEIARYPVAEGSEEYVEYATTLTATFGYNNVFIELPQVEE